MFLLDDHEVVRRGLADLLTSSGDIEVVGESGSAQEAARRIPALRPDVAVLDARLPDGNGIDVCRDVRAAALRLVYLHAPSTRGVPRRAGGPLLARPVRPRTARDLRPLETGPAQGRNET